MTLGAIEGRLSEICTVARFRPFSNELTSSRISPDAVQHGVRGAPLRETSISCSPLFYFRPSSRIGTRTRMLLISALVALATTTRAVDLVRESLSPFPNASFSLARPAYSLVAASAFAAPDKGCPPCNPFNCALPAFSCLNSGASRASYGGVTTTGADSAT